MSNEETLRAIGHIIAANAVVGRDAVHLAVVPMIADRRLTPREHVTVGGILVGIVDPFLGFPVEIGERYWLFLYPGSITSLRHEWTHPAFDAAVADKAESEAWLREFVASADCPNYDTLMAAAVGDHYKNRGEIRDERLDAEYPDYYNSQNDGEYLHFGGRDAHGDIPPEFWDHVQVVSGRAIPSGMRAKFFSCSC